MDPRVYRRIQRYGWDAATATYDREWVPLLERLTHACVNRAALRRGERVLDLATGPGVAALMAARTVGPEGTVTGLDISEKMVELAALRARTHGHSHLAVQFARGDMETIAGDDNAYDAVLCAFGLMFATDRKAVFAEIARLLVPRGRTSVVVWGRRSQCGFAEVFPIVDPRVKSEVCPLFFALGVPGALTHALETAGLTDVVEERLPVTLGWGSADEACAAMLEGGAVALAWQRFSLEVKAAVRGEYLASIEPFREGERYNVPAEVVYATARKR